MAECFIQESHKAMFKTLDNTQCFLRTFHKYGFDKDLKSHDRGQEASEMKPDTPTRPPTPTEDQKNGAEGGFLVLLVLATLSQCHNC